MPFSDVRLYYSTPVINPRPVSRPGIFLKCHSTLNLTSATVLPSASRISTFHSPVFAYNRLSARVRQREPALSGRFVFRISFPLKIQTKAISVSAAMSLASRKQMTFSVLDGKISATPSGSLPSIPVPTTRRATLNPAASVLFAGCWRRFQQRRSRMECRREEKSKQTIRIIFSFYPPSFFA